MAATNNDIHEAIARREAEERRQAVRAFVDAVLILCLALAALVVGVIAICHYA